MRTGPALSLALLALAGAASGALADHRPDHKVPPGLTKPKTTDDEDVNVTETEAETGVTATDETPVVATLDPPAPPVAGESAGIMPAGGEVRVKLPGSDTFIDLADAASIPMGATLDATEGAVALTTTAPGGGTQTATFKEGAFSVTQSGDMAVLRLEGGDFSACGGGARAAAYKGKPKRRIWGSGKGRFRTRGRYSAATVRGTVWLTEDRCDGTLTVVRRGVVAVWDRSKGKRVLVRAGERYLAKRPEAPKQVLVGQFTQGFLR
jgi:hypothetical protein